MAAQRSAYKHTKTQYTISVINIVIYYTKNDKQMNRNRKNEVRSSRNGDLIAEQNFGGVAIPASISARGDHESARRVEVQL